ncbi:hypothetical protein ACJROX_08410 [Pseudalkalibacillus sp. A8]|uniref:hypothetical protein n=1 Tax=Pseudalkalibacillus sp. A8 TaxID=3382641 RepID=UPI0038B42341
MDLRLWERSRENSPESPVLPQNTNINRVPTGKSSGFPVDYRMVCEFAILV